MITRAWLQQDPSPSGGGAYHWHVAVSADGAGGANALALPDRAALAERLHGEPAAAVIWRWSGARLLWARVFTGRAPRDGRPYRGLAATQIDDDALAVALARVGTAPARPWRAADHPGATAGAVALPGGSGDGDGPGATAQREALAALVLRPRARVVVPDAAAPALARRLGAVVARAAPVLLAPSAEFVTVVDGVNPEPSPAAQVLAAATVTDAAARGWRVLVELAAARASAVVALEPELTAVARAWRDAAGVAALVRRLLTDDEAARLARGCPGGLDRQADADAAWMRLVHAWGRGVFDGVASARSLPTRLAEVIAARAALVPAWWPRLRADLDWRWLLPRARRDVLRATLRDRVPTLELGDG